MKSRREEKKRATRRRILDKATELFRSQGYEHTSVTQIAAEAGVSRQTFFNYFPEKREILDRLVERADRRFERYASLLSREPGTTHDRVAKLFRDFAGEVEAQPELSRVLLEAGVGGRSRSSLLPRRSRRWVAGFEEILAAGAAQGDVRDDLPLPSFAELAVGAFLSCTLGWAADPTYPLRERLAQAARLVADAAAPREPAPPEPGPRDREA